MTIKMIFTGKEDYSQFDAAFGNPPESPST